MNQSVNFIGKSVGILSLVGLLLAGCGQTPTPVLVNPNQLDSKGGTIRSSDNNAALIILSQTLNSSVVFSLTPSNQTIKAPNDKVLVSGSMYALSSTPSTTLSKASTLSIKFDPAAIAALGQKLEVNSQAAANTLEVVRLVNNAWEVVGGSTADTTSNTVQAPITEMGVYALLAPDGSKPAWRLEVRGGIGAIDQETSNVTPLRDTLNRNLLYISLSRNGQTPTTPVAVQVSGPNGFTTTIAYPANRAWGIYTLSTRQAGQFSLRLSADGQDLVGTVDIADTPTLPLPAITTRVASGQVQASWLAVEGAQSYEVRLYSNTLALLQTVQTKNLNTNLTIPSNLAGQTVAVMVLAHTWDNVLDRGQPYPAALERVNLSASLAVLTGGGGSPNPGGNQPNLSGPNPETLNLVAAVGRSSSGTVSLSNIGNAPLTYNATVSGTGFRITFGATGSLAGLASPTQITVEGTCGSTATTLSGTLTITSNDPDTPSASAALRLNCFRPFTSNLVFSRVSHSSTPILTQYSPDGSSLASLSTQDGRIIVWNTDTGAVRRVFSLGTANSYDGGGFLVWSPNSQRIAATNQGAIARVWDISTGQNVVSLEGLTNFTALAWRPDGARIAAINTNNTSEVAVFDVGTGGILQRFNPSDNTNPYRPSQIAWASTGRILTFSRFSSTFNFPNTIAVWNLDTSPVSQATTYTYDSIATVSQDGSQIVGIMRDTNNSQLYLETRQSTTGALVRRMGPISTPGTYAVRDLLFSNDRQRIGIVIDPSGGSSPGAVQLEVWNATNGTQVLTPSTIGNGERPAGSLGWNSSGSQIALPLMSGHIRLVNTSNNQTIQLLGYNTSFPSSLRLNNSNQLLSASNGVLAWSNLSSGQTQQVLLLENTSPLNATWRSNGNITLFTTNNILRTINTQTGAQVSSISLQDAPASSGGGIFSAFSPDGGRLLLAIPQNNQYVVQIHSTDTGARLASLQQVGSNTGVGGFSSFAWSADGSRVWGANSSHFAEVGVWNTTSGERTSLVQMNSPSANCFGSYSNFSFSQDGSRMLCIGMTNSLAVFDTATGQQLNSPSGTTAPDFSSARLAPNGLYYAAQRGTQILVVSLDGATLASLPRIIQGQSSFYGTNLVWADNTRLLVGEGDGTVQVWQLNP